MNSDKGFRRLSRILPGQVNRKMNSDKGFKRRSRISCSGKQKEEQRQRLQRGKRYPDVEKDEQRHGLHHYFSLLLVNFILLIPSENSADIYDQSPEFLNG